MKNIILCAVVVALTGSGVLFSSSAHAQGLVTVNRNWQFNDASGSCDSLFTGGCGLDNWWTGGRAGWNTANGNGFLWISHDDPWNSWNTEFNASGWNASKGECTITADVYSTDSYTSTIGELDLWEDRGGGNLTFLSSGSVFGTNGNWSNQSWYDLPINQAVLDGRSVLMVFGRHQNEGNQQFIAVDNVTAYCWVYN